MLFLLFIVLFNSQADVDSIKETIGEIYLEAAKKYIDVPFVWGGRSKYRLDCMGLPFLAYTDITGRRWQKLSVFPSELVESRKLGEPVKGLDGILGDSIDYAQLEEGDIIYFLIATQVGNVGHFVEIDSAQYWVWHMGIFAGLDEQGMPLVLHARPGDKVVIEPMDDIFFEAIYVARME